LKTTFGLLSALLLTPFASAQTFPVGTLLDSAVGHAIAAGQIPGAVLVIGHNGNVVYRKAYGNRALIPQKELMTVDTVFDCASLTKVVVTSTAMMKLVEEGKIRLNDRVTDYLPGFQGGKSEITIRQLLTHFSGLRPDVDLKPVWTGYETGIRLALVDKPRFAPGERFVYSDINFILLGEIVRKLTGENLADYARRILFEPLGMKDSMFLPPANLRLRIAPTEGPSKGEAPLRGVVHDETTRYMGGIAGHAGLFATADDLARFAQMMLNKGKWGQISLFDPLVVEKFTTPQTPADQPVLRGFGWDIDSPFSGNRGDLFPVGSFGHTGFTGTSMWIDPWSQTYVVLLTNSVHPVRKPAITSLRGKIATLTAAAYGIQHPQVRLTGYSETMAGVTRPVLRNGDVRTGLDVWNAEKFVALKGKRVGLITNHTGVDRLGRRNLDLMVEAGVNVTAVFSPEHGIQGTEDHENVGNSRDSKTHVRIWSLYAGETRRPTTEMLRDVDLLVFDIQDIGARFYTYLTTMANAMEEAAKAGKPFYVLDRPNPINGVRVEGPVLEPANASFVGYYSIPVRHGMTAGELAILFNTEAKIKADLTVIPMQGWQRGDWFDFTGLPWIDPSPNMRSLTAALLYPAVALLEYCKNYSVGRGTDTPFEVIGADFIDGRALSSYLNKRQIAGLRTYPIRFRPSSSNFSGHWVGGVRLVVTDRHVLNTAQAGLEIAAALEKLYPGMLDFGMNRRLIGSDRVIQWLRAGDDPRTIVTRIDEEIQQFLAVRERYLRYR
jgi:uncharacterized protein YbbC (DUF1343 family)/CubicO group peptidase (beta-lactamase class C family)